MKPGTSSQCLSQAECLLLDFTDVLFPRPSPQSEIYTQYQPLCLLSPKGLQGCVVGEEFQFFMQNEQEQEDPPGGTINRERLTACQIYCTLPQSPQEQYFMKSCLNLQTYIRFYHVSTGRSIHSFPGTTFKSKTFLLGTLAFNCNPSTQWAEAGGLPE